MQSYSYLRLLIVSFLLVSLSVGCGGGGGGGGASSSGLTYTGLTSQATIDENNAQQLVGGIMNGGGLGPRLAIGAVKDSESGNDFNLFSFSRLLENAMLQVDFFSRSYGYNLGAVHAESGTDDGHCGGSLYYNVTVDDQSGNFDGTLTFNNFCDSGIVISGPVEFSGTIDLVTEEPISYQYSFTGLTVTDIDSMTIKGDMDFVLNEGLPASGTITMNFLLMGSTGTVYRFANFIMEAWDGDDAGGDHTMATLTGRFFEPDYGYVDITTPTPLKIYWDDKWPSAGIQEIEGANGIAGGRTMGRLTVIDNVSYFLEADTNGDGAYDYNFGSLNWSELYEDSTSSTFQISDYFPLEQGDTWTYREEDAELTTKTTSGTENIGGVNTTKIIDEDGDYTLFTNTNGITIYKNYDADDISGCGWSDVTYIPPATIAPAEVSIGTVYTFNTTLNHTECTGFSESAAVTFELTFEGFEDVTGTGGTFEDCLKFKMKQTGNFPNNQVSINEMTIWSAKGVGEVKSTNLAIIDGNVIDVYTLDLISATVGGIDYP